VLTRDHTVLPATHTFIHEWNVPYLPLLPSHRASPRFGRYSFFVPLRVEGGVGLVVVCCVLSRSMSTPCNALSPCVHTCSIRNRSCHHVGPFNKERRTIFSVIISMFIQSCYETNFGWLNAVLDAPWCEIRPTHDSFKHVRTTFPSRKKEKFEDKLHVKSRNEPSCIM